MEHPNNKIVDNNYTKKLSDDISKFTASEAWRLVQYKLLVEYPARQQELINKHVRDDSTHKAMYNLGLVDGVKMAVELTEQLSKEISQGKLDVDGALTVIENKQRMGKW